MKDDPNRCSMPHCRRPREMTYHDRPLCAECFGTHNLTELRAALGLPQPEYHHCSASEACQARDKFGYCECLCGDCMHKKDLESVGAEID